MITTLAAYFALLTTHKPAQEPSKSVTVVAKAGPLQGVTAYTDSYALFVGIDQYENKQIPRIPSAPNDARTMRDLLTKEFGFNPDHTEVLTNEQATKRNIERAIAKLCDRKTIKPTDRILVFFSCHGQGVPLPGGEEIGYIIPYDAEIELGDLVNVSGFQTSCLKMDELVDRLKASPARHRAVIVDACFSGFSAGKKALGSTTFAPEALKKLLGERGLFVMTAGSTKEEAAGSRSATGLSLYTRTLIETLKEASIQGGTYTASQLFAESAAKTMNVSKGAQNPQSDLRDGVGQMVFFSPVSGVGAPVASEGGAVKKLPTTAGLDIRVTPIDAKIEVDGKVVNPSSSQELEPGGKKTVIVKVSAPGFVTEGYEVEIVAGKTTPINVELKAVPVVRINYANFAVSATLSGHSEDVTPVSFSPDGNTIASGSVDKTIKLWDASTGTLKTTLTGHGNLVSSVCFSPDGNTLASGSLDSTIKLWDARTGTLKTTLTGHMVLCVSFSPDGKTIASAGTAIESGDNTIKLWDARTGTLKTTLTGHGGMVSSVCFSPDGNIIASGSLDRTIKLWDARTGALQTTLTGHDHEVYSVCFSPDGKTIASGSFNNSGKQFDNTVKLWDVSTGTLKTTLKDSNNLGFVCYSPDGNTIASGSADNTIKLWDAKTGALTTTLKHSNSVGFFCFSPDGNTIASASGDKTIKLWRMPK